MDDDEAFGRGFSVGMPFTYFCSRIC